MVKHLMSLFVIVFLLFGLAACQENINPSNKEVTSISQPEPIHIERFQEFDFSKLPTTVEVILADGSKITVNVSFDDGFEDVDETTSNELTIMGSLVLDERVLNSNEFIVVQQVIVDDIDALSTLLNIDRFSLFASAIEATGLDYLLSLEGPYTLFTPNNQAIENYLDTIGSTFEEWIERDDSADMLSYHILNSKRSASVLTAMIPSEVTSITGEALTLSLSQARITLNNYSKVITHDIKASNAIIHEVDSVLIAPSTLDGALDEFFDEAMLERFQEFLEDSGLLFEIISGGRFTILLPTEEAFMTLAEEQSMSLDSLINSDMLFPILTYHIIRGEHFSERLYADAPINLSTVEGSVVRVDVVDQALTIGGAMVLSVETMENIGVIYTIDRVLIPEGVNFD